MSSALLAANGQSVGNGRERGSATALSTVKVCRSISAVSAYSCTTRAVRSASGSIVPLNAVDEALACAEANGLLPADPAGKLEALARPWRFGGFSTNTTADG